MLERPSPPLSRAVAFSALVDIFSAGCSLDTQLLTLDAGDEDSRRAIRLIEIACRHVDAAQDLLVEACDVTIDDVHAAYLVRGRTPPP